jgi:hypothetical protein
MSSLVAIREHIFVDASKQQGAIGVQFVVRLAPTKPEESGMKQGLTIQGASRLECRGSLFDSGDSAGAPDQWIWVVLDWVSKGSKKF